MKRVPPIIECFMPWLLKPYTSLPCFDISGQSYKASAIVIYDSRVVPDLKIPHITTLEL